MAYLAISEQWIAVTYAVVMQHAEIMRSGHKDHPFASMIDGHYNDVKRARRRLKSPGSWLFTQPFIQAQIKESVNAPRHWPLCGEFTGEIPPQRASNAQNVSIWWRHHVMTGTLTWHHDINKHHVDLGTVSAILGTSETRINEKFPY